MSKKEYSVREQNIVKKLNEVNNILNDRKIKIQYSVYNYNGIASKLEKTDLYDTDVTNSVFLRTHVCKAEYMIDQVVKSCQIQNNIEIEENFNTKITDIENASVEELVEYFGDMSNHEKIGIGNNQKYQMYYKGTNNNGQNVEIKATYGNGANYDIRTSVTKINNDGTISKVYYDKIAVADNNNGINESVVAQGLENRNPESYSIVEKNIGANGKNSFVINYLGNNETTLNIEAEDEAFDKIKAVSFGGATKKYIETQGKIEKATGKLMCRIDYTTGTIVKPNFRGVSNIVKASEVTDNFYNQYKDYPTINFDSKAQKFIVKGTYDKVQNINLDTVLANAKNDFIGGCGDNISIEVQECNKVKKYLKIK